MKSKNIYAMSPENSAYQLSITTEGDFESGTLSSVVIGDKGYAMSRAAYGISSGSCYVEVEILDRIPDAKWTNLPEPHIRLGFSTAHGMLQCPVGYDWFSFSYRDKDGSKFHQAVRQDYGRPFGPGDVIGMLIELPPLPDCPETEPPEALKQTRDLGFVWHKTTDYKAHPVPGSSATDRVLVVEGLQVHPKSRIEFFVNGEGQGTAFEDIPQGIYYPAVSLYMGARVRVRFGGSNFKAFPKRLEERKDITPAGKLPNAMTDFQKEKEETDKNGLT